MNVNEHVQSPHKTASQKVKPLSNAKSILNFQQRQLIMNTFITSHFSYCRMFDTP